MPSGLMLAYLGDCVYELYVRKQLINQNYKNMATVQKKSLDFVSAKSQRKHLENLINNEILSDEEIEYVRQGRNLNSGKSKSSDIITYRYATGLEYLIGILMYNNNIKRIEEIMNYILVGGI